MHTGPPTPQDAGVTCEDCYFRQAALCALAGNEPCPTFRAMEAEAGAGWLPPEPVMKAAARRERVVVAA